MENTRGGNAVFNIYTKYPDYFHVFFLVTLSISVFYNSLNGYLLVDDFFNTVGPGNRNIFNVFITNAYGGNAGGHYRPMEALSHMFDNYFYGDYYHFGRHLTNLILHIMNGIIVYIIASMITKRKTLGLVAGLFFAINPIHSQSLPAVAWISGRTDLIVAFFYLLTFLLFLVFSFNKSYISYFMSLITFMLALLSKEMAVTLPFVILLYIMIFNNYKEKEYQNNGKLFHYVWWSILLSGVLLVIVGIIINIISVAYVSYNKEIMQSIFMKSRLLKFGIIISGFSLILMCVILKLSNKASRFILSVRYIFPYFFVLVFYFVVRYLVLKGFGGIYKSTGENVILQLGIDTFMRDFYSLSGMIWPLRDSYYIDMFTFQIEHTLWFYSIIISALTILAVLFCKLMSYSRTATYFVSWIFITMIPVHNIIISTWGYQPRYLYIPSVGYCIFISILLGSLSTHSKYGSESSNIFKNIFVTAILIAYIGMNSYFIFRHNEKIVKSGEVMRELVSDIKNNWKDLSDKRNIYFITFPLSPIDSFSNVWVNAYMDDILNYADNSIGFKKSYTCNYILFLNGGNNEMINIKWIGGNKFILENVNYDNCHINPKNFSSKEKQIEKIYKMLPSSPILQELPAAGENIEINGALITVLDINTSTKRAKLLIEIKDDLKKLKENMFYIYAHHHYRLIRSLE